DADADSLTAVLATTTPNGSLTFNANGTFDYTPNANFNGPDSFTYRTTDGCTTSLAATVSISVGPVNDPPVANNDSYTINEDTPLSSNVLTNDTDVDGDTLTASVVAGPSHGTLNLNPNGS